MIRKLWLAAAALAASGVANATIIFSENFDNAASLAGAGWTFTNNSSPPGSFGWFQDSDTPVFNAHSGAANSYIAANFESADLSGGAISSWLITPMLTLDFTTTLTFYTRSAGFFEDALEVRLSTNGASGDVGATATSVGDFSNLLLSVNPLLNGSYPTDWTAYTVQLLGVSPGTLGRIAFRYTLPDNVSFADYIGVDSLSIAVPEPSVLALLAASLIGLAWIRRRRPTN